MSDNRMKILYITRKYPPAVGGMENFAFNLYKGFDEAVVDKTIIKLGGKQINLLWFFPYAFFRTLFTAHKYDVIFVGDAVLSSIGYFAKKLNRKKTVVINVFGLDITYKNGLYQWYLRRFYKGFDKYIAISKDTEDELKKRGDYDSCIITPGVVFNDGLTKTDKKFGTVYGISEDELLILTVGRLVKRKGVAWFVENVLPKLEDLNYRYVVVGSGEDESRIKALVKNLGLEDRVILTGRIDQDLLDAAYREADIFAMPNIHVDGDMEGFGIVACEAAAAENIVIASAIEGIRDAIKNGKNGILVESGDADAFARVIRDVRDNRDDYRDEAKSFAEYTRKHYSWKKICDEYIDLFRQMKKRDNG